MQQGPNWIHLVALLVIVGFSVISWIYRQLNEQAAKKRARDMIDERRREMLRTGRDPGEAHGSIQETSESQRQREITARREAQLAELRRRAQARQAGETSHTPRTPSQAPPILTIPGSAGPTVPQARPTMGPTIGPAPKPRPAAPRPTPRPVFVPRPAKPKKPAPRPQPLVRAEEEETTHRLVADEAPAPGRRPSPIVVATPQTPEEWRRAIIANEILSPPLSQRSGVAPVPF